MRGLHYAVYGDNTGGLDFTPSVSIADSFEGLLTGETGLKFHKLDLKHLAE